jgi:hypothetical protein
LFDSKISAAVCLSTKKSETMKEANRTGLRIVRDIIDSTSGEEVEDAGLGDMMVHFNDQFNLDQVLVLIRCCGGIRDKYQPCRYGTRSTGEEFR